MPNVLDYVKANQALSFDDLAFNELDLAVLNELAYIPLTEGQEEAIAEAFLPLREIVDVSPQPLDDVEISFMATANRLALLEEVLASQRYDDLLYGYYVNDVDSQAEKQFAAVVAYLPCLDYYQLIFRGTDETLIGWKEDFNMTYLDEIPAQTSACDYLARFLRHNPVDVTVSGHSKGGNLAVYASSFIDHSLQSYLKAIYILDAPGVQEQVLATEGYQAIRERIIAYKPQESIVGVMLASDVSSIIVASQKRGILQHDMFNWQITDQQFSRVEALSHLSLSLQETFVKWMDEYSKHDLKQLSDAFFDLFFSLGIEDVDSLMAIDWSKTKALLNQMMDLDSRKKVLLFDALKTLLSIYHQSSLTLALEAGKSKWQDFWGQVQTDMETFVGQLSSEEPPSED